MKPAVLRLAAVCFLIVCFVWVSPVDAQNSTRKIRVRPSGLSRQIGKAVHWKKNVRDALKASADSGKPVFWYVPTLTNSFMDRKDSIDRYMMAGPFSWPQIIQELNQKFECVRSVPDSEMAKKFDLVPYKFIEPGIVILDSKGSLQKKVDRITTLSPEWFLKRIQPDATWQSPTEYWKRYAEGAREFSIPEKDLQGRGEQAIANQFLNAVLAFRQGEHRLAKKRFEEIAKSHPEHPLAWKASAEAQGFGPFVRGFEVYERLAESTLKSSADVAGTTVPKNTYVTKEIWERSTRYLLGMQRKDGGWVDSDYDFGGTDSLPNVHVAVTALAGMALLDAQAKLPERSDRIQKAIDRAVDFVSDERNLNRMDRDEILWAQAYRTRFLSRVKQSDRVKPLLQRAVKDLENIQTKRGSWYHEYPNPFVTATALCALKEAQQAGATVDTAKVAKGVSALKSDRFQNGAFPYSSGRRAGGVGTARNIAASAGRMPLCQVGLFYWDQQASDAELKLTKAIKDSFDLHRNLMSALKYDDHTSNLAYGGFFFWYDMRGRCEAIAQLNDAAMKRELFQKQQELILGLVEIDGCFVDSHELGRCYGTAMALLCLKMCE